jgi:hypothetical protein
MKTLRPLKLILVATLVFTANVRAEDLAPGDVTARNFAKLALLGAKWQLQKSGFPDAQVAQQMDCLKKLEVSRLAPVFAGNLREHFNADELRELDAFIASPAGQKVNKMGELQFYRNKGDKPTESAPQFTADESADLMRFSLSEVGQRYSKTDLFVSKSTHEKASDRMAEVMAECLQDPAEDPASDAPNQPRPL